MFFGIDFSHPSVQNCHICAILVGNSLLVSSFPAPSHAFCAPASVWCEWVRSNFLRHRKRRNSVNENDVHLIKTKIKSRNQRQEEVRRNLPLECDPEEWNFPLAVATAANDFVTRGNAHRNIQTWLSDGPSDASLDADFVRFPRSCGDDRGPGLLQKAQRLHVDAEWGEKSIAGYKNQALMLYQIFYYRSLSRRSLSLLGSPDQLALSQDICDEYFTRKRHSLQNAWIISELVGKMSKVNEQLMCPTRQTPVLMVFSFSLSRKKATKSRRNFAWNVLLPNSTASGWKSFSC